VDITCSLCNGFMKEAFKATLLRKYHIQYYFCNYCGFLRTEEPYWFDKAYSKAIPFTDTGLVWRNISLSQSISSLLFVVFGERGNGIYLDRAGGYGIFVRLMRDLGFNFRWSDPYAENIFAQEFEGDEIPIYRAVTAFDVIEHLYDPMTFIEKSLQLTMDGLFIFSTQTFEGKPPLPDAWWYYSLETGQHISFYQTRTIDYIAKKLNVYYHKSKYIHVFSRRKINLFQFLLATSVLKYPLALLARKYLGSKTQLDHDNLMIERSKSF